VRSPAQLTTTFRANGGATRFDPILSDHHHAKCDLCGDLRDVYVPDVDTLPVSGFDGFVPQRAGIMFGGLCAVCQQVEPMPTPHRSLNTIPNKETS